MQSFLTTVEPEIIITVTSEGVSEVTVRQWLSKVSI